MTDRSDESTAAMSLVENQLMAILLQSDLTCIDCVVVLAKAIARIAGGTAMPVELAGKVGEMASDMIRKEISRRGLVAAVPAGTA